MEEIDKKIRPYNLYFLVTNWFAGLVTLVLIIALANGELKKLLESIKQAICGY